jgi:nucleoside-diphosphate-sugar epimerase
MKVMITGGAGFIGTNLALTFDKNDVVLVDLPGKFSEEHSGFNIFECDITDADQVKSLPEADIVYHLAGQVGTYGSLRDLSNDLKQNTVATLNMLEWSSNKNVHSFVFASSMAVYGHRIHASELEPLHPVSPYGISKQASEIYVNYFQKRNQHINYSVFRIYNCYGPGQSTKNKTKGLASIFLEQAKEDKGFSVTGTLDRTRDLVYIDDVVSGLRVPFEKKVFSGTFNLCSGTSTSIKELIDATVKVAKTRNRKISSYKENISEDPLHSTGDNYRLKECGWTPKVDLENGLRKCWETINE